MGFITLTVRPGKPVEIDTSGFTGTACQRASQNYVTALGGLKEERIKDEMYTEEPINLHEHQ